MCHVSDQHRAQLSSLAFFNLKTNVASALGRAVAPDVVQGITVVQAITITEL